MIKAKLLPFFLKSEWENFGKKLLSAKYSEEEARGITVNDFSTAEINATYYEKIVYSETLHDPINGEHEVSRVTFLATNFTIYENGILCIISPSRRISSLINYLMSKTLHEFTITETIFCIDIFCKFASDNFEKFNVTRSTYKQFNLTDNLKCTMALTSQDGVFKQLNSINIDIPKIPSKITFDGILWGKYIKGDISESGLIASSYPKFTQLIEHIVQNKNILFR